jgi:hypothetical protein
MIKHHAEDGEGAEAVDVRTIGAIETGELVSAHAYCSGEATELQPEKCAVLQVRQRTNESGRGFWDHFISVSLR